MGSRNNIYHMEYLQKRSFADDKRNNAGYLFRDRNSRKEQSRDREERSLYTSVVENNNNRRRRNLRSKSSNQLPEERVTVGGYPEPKLVRNATRERQSWKNNLEERDNSRRFFRDLKKSRNNSVNFMNNKPPIPKNTGRNYEEKGYRINLQIQLSQVPVIGRGSKTRRMDIEYDNNTPGFFNNKQQKQVRNTSRQNTQRNATIKQRNKNSYFPLNPLDRNSFALPKQRDICIISSSSLQREEEENKAVAFIQRRKSTRLNHANSYLEEVYGRQQQENTPLISGSHRNPNDVSQSTAHGLLQDPMTSFIYQQIVKEETIIMFGKIFKAKFHHGENRF